MQLCALAYNRIGTITTLQFVRMRVKEGSHYVIEVERERERATALYRSILSSV